MIRIVLAALLASACTRTVTVRVPARIPCLPSEPPIPSAEYGTAAHAEQYVLLLGWTAYVAAACDVAPTVSDVSTGDELIPGPYGD